MKCYCGRKMKKVRTGGLRCVNGGKHRDRKTQQQIAEGAARKFAAMEDEGTDASFDKAPCDLSAN